MRCIYCNTPLGASDYCTGCGADITIQKRIVRISNLLYNEGLEKARVRDIEGAVTCLNRSLKFNKENTEARNLLGLCYYEIGEAVQALCEWVISKNLQEDNDLADYFIDELQDNKNRLDTLNQAIRKYNQSVRYCREDNEDMAIIQLRKVISHNPKFVKAYQLLALLYMKREEYERARKLLQKALQTDATNTTTLRYLQEIGEATGKNANPNHRQKKHEKEPDEDQLSGTLRYLSGNEMIIQPTTFRDSSTIATFINIVLGILLGGAIVWFLIVPANRQTVNDSANKQINEINAQLASAQVESLTLQKEIDGFEDQIAEVEDERNAALTKADSYDDLMSAANLYVSGKESDSANMLQTLNADDFDDNAKALYDTLSKALSATFFQQYYYEGTTAYVKKDYATAAKALAKAVEADPDRLQSDHYNALLYLGMAYFYLKDTANADAAFNQIIEYYPENASVIEGYISSNPSTINGTTINTIDLSGLGDATTAGNMTEESEGTGSSEDGASENTGSEDGEVIVFWTDPISGTQYDTGGNVID